MFEDLPEEIRSLIKLTNLYNNMEEDEASLIPQEKLDIEICGTTLTPDRSDCYITIYLNGRMKDGTINLNPIICRVSLLGPYYIDNPNQSGIKLNKDQKEIFINYVTNNWDRVLLYLSYNYDTLDIPIDFDKYKNLPCPDYSQLDTI